MSVPMETTCPTCRMKLLIPAERVRYCPMDHTPRVAFDCDDCGIQFRTISWFSLSKLIIAGMPDAIEQEEWVAFQVPVVRRDFCPVEVIEREAVSK